MKFLVTTATLLFSLVSAQTGVPDVNSLAVQKHLRSRSALISYEKRQRQDHFFRQNLSSVAQRADAIVAAIRQEEIDEYWRVPGTPEKNDTDERFAGEVFPKARPLINGTKLWEVVKHMPKGALLHAHLAAMLPYETLLETILHTEGMVFSASQDLSTEDNRKNASIEFAHVNHTIATNGSSIYSKDYVPNTPIPVTVAASTFPGGQQGFIDFINTKVTISPEQSVRHELGVDEIWRVFQTAFGPANTMLSYEPVVRTFYQKLFSRLAEDHINWVEIRAGGSSGKLVHEGEEDPDPDLDIWWDVLLEELEKFQKTPQGAEFWGARVIWSDSRGKNRASLTKSMGIALERKRRHPQLFSGYDVVAQEDLGRPLAEMAPELIWFQQQAEESNLTIPFFFHAGETLGDGNSTDLNLFDAVLFGTRRIGHGFSLYKHPRLIDEVIENGIMVEVCPISNEVLRLATDILHHPLPAMIAHGIPTAISNDDPAILGQNAAGLSYDFYQTIQAFDNVGLAGLGALAQNSIRWSNFEDQNEVEWVRDIDFGENGDGIKAKRLQQWSEKWEAFCEWVVREYGDRYATEEL
ncbi:adenosine deaminase family protein [Aspergillus bombycis]|uniref:adenosine deaminase n=1 Tax=Aspergillus bombycis TaxID=109264 RepID=A0A1F8A017_9EURO|nr:adenosine deaminase family protein [Aspergillus bombycis]OGM45041.1 adenosine deaminase family protein [Aspergillus bombycis]